MKKQPLKLTLNKNFLIFFHKYCIFKLPLFIYNFYFLNKTIKLIRFNFNSINHFSKFFANLYFFSIFLNNFNQLIFTRSIFYNFYFNNFKFFSTQFKLNKQLIYLKFNLLNNLKACVSLNNLITFNSNFL